MQQNVKHVHNSFEMYHIHVNDTSHYLKRAGVPMYMKGAGHKATNTQIAIITTGQLSFFTLFRDFKTAWQLHVNKWTIVTQVASGMKKVERSNKSITIILLHYLAITSILERGVFYGKTWLYSIDI